ncbi:methylenetetrahydrofolate reductase [Rhizomonospora bruguierae]|uniref:methylenetetrahydrofolate reductase n=1 Tax=Rhizomonospora bruguierae TaxID=1581705 RepID=UPI001BD09491|nr:methylenetetrahydrofolate reductase [Micromonospora sp. NBRC 107566]
MTEGLRATLSAHRFAVTAEVGLPHGADPDGLTARVTALKGWVDAVNIIDNASAKVAVSSLAGAVIALRAGVEPVMQLTCRDRNRIALQSDLLGAATLGIPNVLLLTGDHPRFGDHPQAKAVFDLDSIQLTWLARTMRDDGRLLSGRRLDPPPRFLVGAVENPFAPPIDLRAARLAKKVAAGAEFVQTQLIFDVPTFERFLRDVRDLGVADRVAILAGVGPVRSLRALEFLQRSVPGVHIPDEIAKRLRGVTPERVAEEGVRQCIETIDALAGLPGVAGIHLMAFGFERGIPELIQRSAAGALRSTPSSERGGDGAH